MPAVRVGPLGVAAWAHALSGLGAAAPTMYVDGPPVGNFMTTEQCDGSGHTLEAAKQRCSADPDCLVLHSYDCLPWAWRTCSSTIEEIQAVSVDSEACTLLKQQEESTQSSTVATGTSYTSTSGTTTTLTPGIYVDGPAAANNAYVGKCSSQWYTLEGAQAACDADPGCSFLFAYDCLDWAWSSCGGADDLAEIVDSSNSAEACTKVLISLVTSTDTATSTSATETSATATSTTATTSATTTATSATLTMFTKTSTTTSSTSATTQAEGTTSLVAQGQEEQESWILGGMVAVDVVGAAAVVTGAATCVVCVACAACCLCWRWRQSREGRKSGRPSPVLPDAPALPDLDFPGFGAEKPFVPTTLGRAPSFIVEDGDPESLDAKRRQAVSADSPLADVDQELFGRVVAAVATAAVAKAK